MARQELSFLALGRPAPQGSKTPTKYGGFRESSKHLKPWRLAVSEAAKLAMYDQDDMSLFDGPVAIKITWFIQKPAKSKWADYPAGPPDMSKLLRATEDALTGVAWVDDALVVKAFIEMVWTGTTTDTYPEPGARVTIKAL